MDFQGLAETRASAKQNDPETLRKVAGQFEALFLQMMLKSMRDASLGEGIFDSDHSKTYQSMFDKQISMDLSQQNGIGLADMIVRQLSGNPMGAVSENQPIIPLVDTNAVEPLHLNKDERVRAIVPLNETATKDWTPDSPQVFVDDLWPQALDAAADLGVNPEVLIAQAALETGWGKSMLRGVDGSNSFNLFGIKADASWQGRKVFSDTVEYQDGLMRKERAAFRAYDSPADSFNDYVDFLRSNPRYKTALQAVADNENFTVALQQAGYATDPEYANKINNIISSEPLSNIKNRSHSPLG
jgi:flagellar protein FlgJ